jgi:hypothetical protein
MKGLHEAFLKEVSRAAEELGLNDEQVQELFQELEKKVPGIISESARLIIKTLKSRAKSMLRWRRSNIRKFEKRTRKRWKRAIDLFEMYLVIAFEAGEDFTQEFYEEAIEKDGFVFAALTRLHARSCQVGFEILELMKHGYADAAQARWRTLHEIAVVALIIADNEEEVAERYFIHDIVESYMAMKQYQKYYSDLGEEKLDEKELKEIEEEYECIIDSFGKNFGRQYGWAADVIGIKDVKFVDLEKKAGLEHFRPYYRMASHPVHANVKGILFKVGLPEEEYGAWIAGPTNYGFLDPARGAAISIAQVTMALLRTRPNIDRLVVMSVLKELMFEIAEEFAQVQIKLDKEIGDVENQ